MSEFNPNSTYNWKPETQFTLDGKEFALVLNSLRAFLQTDNAKAVLAAIEASKIIESLLIKAVESGEAKEVTPE